jgi:hypothetical protein
MTLTFTGRDASATPVSTLTATINYGSPTKIDLTALGQIYSMSLDSGGGVFACFDFSPDLARQFSFDNFDVTSESRRTLMVMPASLGPPSCGMACVQQSATHKVQMPYRICLMLRRHGMIATCLYRLQW